MKIHYYDNAIRVEYPEGFESSAVRFTVATFKSLGLDTTVNDSDKSHIKLLTFNDMEDLDSAKFYMMTYPFFRAENEKNN